MRLMTSFQSNPGLADKVKIVLNRVGLDCGHISLKKAQETIGREIFWQIPNDYRTMIEVRNNGVPLVEQAPKAAVTQSIVNLAAALTGTSNTEGDTAEGSRAALTRLFNFWPKSNPARRNNLPTASRKVRTRSIFCLAIVPVSRCPQYPGPE